MPLLHLKLLGIQDFQIRRCVEELTIINGLDVSRFENVLLVHCLDMCLHPNGGPEKAVPISKRALDTHDVTDSFLLRKKIGKLGNDLHQVCREIASSKERHVDEFAGTALYVFLSRTLVKNRPRITPKNWKQNWQIDPRA